MTENKKNLQSNVDDKLFKVKFVPDNSCHLVPNAELCKICESKICTYICPAKVYEWDEEQRRLVIGYENCLECGACRIACEKKCVEWNYPKGNKGVTFKQG